MLSVGTGLAESPTEGAVIQFRDLDLSTDAGVDAVYGRIKTAAWRVCFRAISNSGGIDQQARLRICYADAVADAVHHISQDRLVARHRAQSQIAAN